MTAIDTALRQIRKDLDQEAETICHLVETIHYNGRSGMTSADLTRLYGSNQYAALRRAERLGYLRSNPTGMRERGRRWYTPENYPGEI